MVYPDIVRLYKYRPFNEHSLSIIKTRKVWFANPESFNDPFDCKIPLDHMLTPDKAMAYGRKIGIPEEKLSLVLTSTGEVQEGFKQKWKEILLKTDEELKDVGVFTLSELDNNILLWAHYADCHRGFCIEFERNSNNELGNYERTRPVLYRSDYPIIDPTKGEEAFDLKLFTKALDWAYEKEWRLVNDEGDTEESLTNVSMTAIIFGLRMPESHKEIIRKLSSDITNMKYRQAAIVPGSFSLIITDT